MGKGRPSKEEALAYIAKHGCTTLEASKVLGVPESTLRRWVKAARTSGGQKPTAKAYPPPNGRPVRARGKSATPAKDLSNPDRATAENIVRYAYGIVETSLRRLHEAVQQAEAPIELDQRSALALQAIQRTASGVVETHPGLMALRKEGEAETQTDGEQLDRIEAALKHAAGK